MNARILPFTADFIEPVTVTIPVKLKCPPNLETMVLEFVAASHKVPVPRGGRAEYFEEHDAPDFEPIREEIERLYVCEYDLGEILGASTGLLLALSRFQGTIAAIPEAKEAVERFRAAVAGVNK